MSPTEAKSLKFEVPQKPWRKWLIAFCVWTVLALSFATRSILSNYQAGTDLFWKETLSGTLIDFYIWALVSPLVFWIVRRFPIEREKLTARLLFHLILSAVLSWAVLDLSLPVLWYLGYPPRKFANFGEFFNVYWDAPYYIHQGLLIYWSLLVLAHAIEYYRQLRIQKIQAAELSAQLAQAQLSALKMQVHPHFLFNTLNSIAALLHKDVELADKMIARLSDFLRMTLNSSNTSVTTLGQELEFLKTYLEIEKIRFQERLIIEIKADHDSLEAQVPNLILQPLVENAVRHGVAKRKTVGRLEVTAVRAADRLIIRVKDNGPGLSNGNHIKKSTGGGLGLANTRARLEQFYENDFKFEIGNDTNGNGAVVNIDVPFID